MVVPIAGTVRTRIAILDGGGRIQAVNNDWSVRLEAVDPFGPDFAIGDDYVARLSESERPSADRIGQTLRQVLGGQSAESWDEFPCPTRGEDRWLSLRAARLVSQPSFQVLVAYVESALPTGRPDDYLLLRLAIEQANDSILITDREGRILFANPAFERITGYSREEAIGRNPRFLRSGEHDPAFYEKMWATLSAGQIWKSNLVDRRKDGSLLEVESTICPVRDAEGEIVQYIGIQRDISEVRQIESQLRHAQRMEAIGRLAGGVAHDFNNLLTVIAGYADLLRLRLKKTGQPTPELAQIGKAVERASELNRRLLAFSRRQILRPRIVDLNVIVRDLEAMVVRLLGERVVLETDLAPRLPSVRVDAGQMGQVLLNLVVNAHDAMPDGGRLTIRTRAAQGRVLLTVTDTGEGIEPAVLGLVFEPFFTTKAEDRGTGLGLSTVYGIVKQSGGEVGIDSTPGQGTTFTIDLPAVDEPTDDEADEVRPSTESFEGDERILVVEDEAPILELVGRHLEAAGYSYDGARSAEEATVLLERNTYDLLLTDAILGGAGGVELAREARRTHPDLRVLFMSGYASEELARQGVAATGDELLEKPFARHELLGRVRQALDRPPS